MTIVSKSNYAADEDKKKKSKGKSKPYADELEQSNAGEILCTHGSLTDQSGDATGSWATKTAAAAKVLKLLSHL